jgi:hypothetical protein
MLRARRRPSLHARTCARARASTGTLRQRRTATPRGVGPLAGSVLTSHMPAKAAATLRRSTPQPFMILARRAPRPWRLSKGRDQRPRMNRRGPAFPWTAIAARSWATGPTSLTLACLGGRAREGRGLLLRNSRASTRGTTDLARRSMPMAASKAQRVSAGCTPTRCASKTVGPVACRSSSDRHRRSALYRPAFRL